MGIDTEPGQVFTRRKGRVIRFVEKHQDIAMDFFYLDTETGREFDVRDLPEKFVAPDEDDVNRPDRDVHKRVIWRAIDGGHDFH